MKRLILIISIICPAIALQAQTSIKTPVAIAEGKKQIVETACGECQFHMKGKGCHLAVRIEGKSFFVDGTTIDEHGDAHGDDGFCNAVRKAEVTGTIVNDRFTATSFKLLPAEKKNP